MLSQLLLLKFEGCFFLTIPATYKHQESKYLGGLNFEANGYLGLSLNLNKVFESLAEEYNTQAHKSRSQFRRDPSIEMKLFLKNCAHKKSVKFERYRPNRSVSYDF